MPDPDGLGLALVPFIASITGAVTNCDDGTIPMSLDPPPNGINAGGDHRGTYRAADRD